MSCGAPQPTDRLGKTPTDLEVIVSCSRARVWEILNRKRPLTLAQIRALVEGLGIPADRLIPVYDTTQVPRPAQRALAKSPRRALPSKVASVANAKSGGASRRGSTSPKLSARASVSKPSG